MFLSVVSNAIGCSDIDGIGCAKARNDPYYYCEKLWPTCNKTCQLCDDDVPKTTQSNILQFLSLSLCVTFFIFFSNASNAIGCSDINEIGCEKARNNPDYYCEKLGPYCKKTCKRCEDDVPHTTQSNISQFLSLSLRVTFFMFFSVVSTTKGCKEQKDTFKNACRIAQNHPDVCEQLGPYCKKSCNVCDWQQIAMFHLASQAMNNC